MAAEKGRNVSIQLMYESIARECQLKKNPSVNRRCSALEVSRSGYYDWLSRKDLPTPALEIQLRDEIQKIVLEFTGYGYRRVTKELLRRGFSVGHKRVQRLMREDNLLIGGSGNDPKRRIQITTLQCIQIWQKSFI